MSYEAAQVSVIPATRNGLAPAQGLVFDGTSGAAANIGTIGTAPLTIGVKATIPASGTNMILAVTSSATTSATTSAFLIYTYGTSLWVQLNSTIGNYLVGEIANAVTTYVGKTVDIVVVRASTGVVALYINGVATAPAFTSVGATPPADWQATITGPYLLLGITSTAAWYSGALSRPLAYNRALSAAEVLALYQSGAPAGADYGAAGVPASNTSIVTGDNSTFASDTGYWTKSSATIGSGSCTISSGGYILCGGIFVLGKKYRYSITLSSNSGSVLIFNGSNGQVTITGTGTFTGEISTGASTGALYVFSAGGAAVLTGFSWFPLGLLLAPDSNNAGAGLEWLDVSGNRAHIVLPTSGVSWSLPSSQQIVIEASTSTNGNQQLGGASLIDTNKQWRIQSWTVNCSTGTPTISLGNVSAGTQYNAAAVLAAGNNDIPLVTRFPSTANLWVNSNSTATLIHRIVLAPAN
jgi:hypothetical protein